MFHARIPAYFFFPPNTVCYIKQQNHCGLGLVSAVCSASLKNSTPASPPPEARAKLNLAKERFCIYTFLKWQTEHFCGRPSCCILHTLWYP